MWSIFVSYDLEDTMQLGIKIYQKDFKMLLDIVILIPRVQHLQTKLSDYKISMKVKNISCIEKKMS